MHSVDTAQCGSHRAVAGAVVLQGSTRLLCMRSILNGLKVHIILVCADTVQYASVVVLHAAPSVDGVVVHLHVSAVHSWRVTGWGLHVQCVSTVRQSLAQSCVSFITELIESLKSDLPAV